MSRVVDDYSQENRYYETILYALLHDVGKVVLRFAIRYRDGLEKSSVANKTAEEIEKFYGLKIDELVKKRHHELSDTFVEKLLRHAPPSEIKQSLGKIILKSDRLAASERGLIEEKETRGFIEKVWSKLEERISTTLGGRARYTHAVAPMLSPTWLLLKTKYLDSAGLKSYIEKSSGKWSGSKERDNLIKNVFNPVYQAVNNRDENRLIDSIYNLVSELMNEEIWLPIKPITTTNLLSLKAYRYSDAVKESSYSEVALLLHEMVEEAYMLLSSGGRVTRGFIDTVHNILKALTLLVPSAIYWSLVPDISLYSHSKLVAAYTACSLISNNCRLLTIDSNSIQTFISAPVKAAAASRVMRGRSLLVELALESLKENTLTMFNMLPTSNVIVSEGGTVDLIVPNPDPEQEFEKRIEKLEKISDELSKYLGGIIGFTIAYSQPFTVEDTSFDRYVAGEERNFSKILETLSIKLAEEKSRAGCRKPVVDRGGYLAKESDILGFDAITLEPVLMKDPYILIVKEENRDYAELLAPGKLALGDYISNSTHLSLVAGSLARELAAIVSVYAYSKMDEVPSPHSEFIARLIDELSKQFCEKSGQLICHVKTRGELYGANIGFIPLLPTGALHILISAPIREKIYDVEDPESLKAVYSVLALIVRELHEKLKALMQDYPGEYVRVNVNLVNAPHAFIPVEGLTIIYSEKYSEVLDVYRKELKEYLKNLVEAGVDVSLGYILLGVYHPAQLTVEKGVVKGYKLIDLDEHGVIAVAKMDFDMFGEIRSLYTISPSRLITLSDLVNTVVAGKAYLKALEISRNKDYTGYNIDVIPLYAGGDDVTVYGKWSHVVWYMSELYRDIRSALKPLLASVAIAIDDCKTPLLLLYSHAVELLERYAKEVKASCVLMAPYIALACKNHGADCIKYYVVPLEKPSKYYPWITDPSANWNLQILAEILDPLKYVTGKTILTELEKYKRELYIIARIAHEYGELVERGETALDKILSLELLYAYVWSRRREELEELKRALEEKVSEENKEQRLLAYPDDIVGKADIEKALRLLLSAKPILDLILLALRRPDTVTPSKLLSTTE